MDKDSILKNIGTIVGQFEGVDVAYVFGSFTEGDEFNDIDVALLLSKSLDPYKSLKFSLKVARVLEKGIVPRSTFDVKILNESPVEFQFEVLKKGVMVFSRDEDRRIDYEAETISCYLDLKYMYDWLDKEFLARA